MAEAHPVGFQWVMEAKARGATVIHVDPRFSRTSAMADRHVPIRAGSDIAFLGGIINHVLREEKYFREYVLAYTNASTILSEDFVDTEDLDGVFSGLDREHRTYDFDAWRYQAGDVGAAAGYRDRRSDGANNGRRRQVRGAARGEAHGSGGAAAHPAPDTDETLQHPRCVFQVLKRHFSRYTPELVEQICGISPENFRAVCDAVTSNSGRDRTTALVYSVGWTQHSVGVQYIRTGAILQMLLGNMGRPGGGILALRGHASIQGSTDIPTLFDLLPGYLPMPHVHGNEDLDAYVDAESMDNGFWASMRSYLVSLLKAWWGPTATPENDFCYGYLPRLTGSHGTYETVLALASSPGNAAAISCSARTRPSARPTAACNGWAWPSWDWLVVRDFSLIESATWWKDGPEIETGEMSTEDIGTEVFFLPAAAHTEKSGSFTDAQRMLRWRRVAVEPAGDARSDHAGSPARPGTQDPGAPGRRDREGRRHGHGRGHGHGLGHGRRHEHGRDEPPGARPHVGLPAPRPAAGTRRRGGPGRSQRLGRRGRADGRLHPAEGRRLDRRGLLDLLRGLRRRGHAGRPPQAGQPAELGGERVGLGLRRRTGGCCTTGPPPTRRGSPGASARRSSRGYAEQGKWAGHDIADFVADRPPS